MGFIKSLEAFTDLKAAVERLRNWTVDFGISYFEGQKLEFRDLQGVSI
jgi:hypothetical protein